MSMTPTDQTVTKAPRRSLKPAAVFAAAGLMATVAWVGAHQTGDDVRTDKTRLEALDDRTVETAGRHSRELTAPPTSSDSGEPTSTEPTSAGPTTTGTATAAVSAVLIASTLTLRALRLGDADEVARRLLVRHRPGGRQKAAFLDDLLEGRDFLQRMHGRA